MITWFVKLLWRERPAAVATNVGLMVIQGLVPAAQLLVLQRLLDTVALVATSSGQLGPMVTWIVALAGIQGLQALLNAGRQISRAYLRESAGWRLQQLVIERSGQVPLEQFELPEFHDRLERARQAATWRSFMIFENALRIAEVGVNLITFLALLLNAHFLLPVILAAGAAPNLISYLKQGQERYRLRRSQTAEQRKANYLVEVLTDREAAKELRLYQLGSYLMDRWYETAARLRDQRLRLTRSQQLRIGLTRLATILGFTGAVALLVTRSVAGAVSIGAFFSLMQAASRFQGQLVMVLRQVGNLYEETLYLKDLQQFVTMEPVETGTQVVDPGLSYRIDFENLSFAYPGGPYVLKDLTFTIYPGEKVALVGTNGSGKTTLIKLLLGLYQPTKGRILIDGKDLSTFSPESLRKQVAAVFQDYLRYQLTAKENIGFGQTERLADEPAIFQAARSAGADEVISGLQSGIDTTLGRTFEGGQDLSGGQWQKIAIARAYFRQARILVLDEPTAALDARAELEIFDQFRALAGNRTAIFVSHRMASARIADRILVLDNGYLIENGSHDELVKRGGEYAQMFEMQARWYRDGDVASQGAALGDREYRNGHMGHDGQEGQHGWAT